MRDLHAVFSEGITISSLNKVKCVLVVFESVATHRATPYRGCKIKERKQISSIRLKAF